MNETLKNVVIFGNLAKIKFLQEKGYDLHEVDKDGYTFVHIAAEMGHAHVVEFLLQEGACPNKTTNWGYTPLHHAQVKATLLL